MRIKICIINSADGELSEIQIKELKQLGLFEKFLKYLEDNYNASLIIWTDLDKQQSFGQFNEDRLDHIESLEINSSEDYVIHLDFQLVNRIFEYW